VGCDHCWLGAGGGGAAEKETGENAAGCSVAAAFALLDAGASIEATSDQAWLGEDLLAADATDASTGAN
jgi:hypothetical protein